MRKVHAIFGAEHSAHYYYKDNYYSDSGLITSLIVCEIFSNVKRKGKRFSELLKEFKKYNKIAEKNFKVEDKFKVIRKLERKYYRKAKRSEKNDGLTMDFGEWWFNVRASNTEPLVRLNVEAEEKSLLNQIGLSEKEAEKLLGDLNISKSQIPKILSSDPALPARGDLCGPEEGR